MPFQIQLNGTPIFSGAAVSGGSLSAPTTDSSYFILTSGAELGVSTTLPADPDSAYEQFLVDKRQVLVSGGTAVLNGISQIFSSGGYLSFSSAHLMTLQEVGGSNVNIVPTVGFWAESVEDSSGKSTQLRTLTPCITCEDYNNLFAFEMVIYHALNKVGWKIMHTVDTLTVSGGYPEGLWPQYQGLVAAWNFYTYKSEYVSVTTSVRDSLDTYVGWINPTCDTNAFISVSEVVRTAQSTAEGIDQYLIFYTGDLIAPSVSQDNNTLPANGPVPFIYHDDSISGGALYCGGGLTKNSLLAALSGVTTSAVLSGGVINGNLYDRINSAREISDVQDFSSAGGSAWLLGVVGSSIPGNGYAVQGFTLGLPTTLPNSLAIAVDASILDTYSVRSTWWTKNLGSGGAVFGPVRLSDSAKTYNVHGWRFRE